MSNPTSDGGNEMIKAAYGAYSLVKDNLPSDFKFTEQQEDDFIICALRRHGEHLSTHTIDQDTVDPLKLICWIGCAIIDQIKDPTFALQEKVLAALINSLEETLILETGFGLRLSQDDRILFQRLAIQEIKGNSDHGVGFNGLFLAFHCLRASYDAMVNEHAPHRDD
jgi:hypothetical protein